MMLVGSSSQKSQLASGQGCRGNRWVLQGTPARGYGTDHAACHLVNVCSIPPRPPTHPGFGKEREGGRKDITYQARQQPWDHQSPGTQPCAHHAAACEPLL